MAGRIRAEIMAEVGPILAQVKQATISGTAALVARGSSVYRTLVITAPSSATGEQCHRGFPPS
jgi:hypothetical protein